MGIDLGIRIFFKKDVRLCVITSPPFFMASCCALFAKLSGKKYIFDVRDRYPKVLEDLGVLKLTSFLGEILKIIESWVYGGAIPGYNHNKWPTDRTAEMISQIR